MSDIVDTVLKEALKVFPNCEVGEDNEGQVLVHTGVYINDEEAAATAVKMLPPPRVLTIGEVSELANIHQWACTNARIVWIDEEVTGTETQTGTARSIGDENGNFLNKNDDVRDAFFRITTSLGFELFMPISKAMKLVRDGRMVEDAV